MTTGEKIKLLRKRQHMTQTELGSRLGVQKNAVSKWECGRVEDIPSSKLRLMAQLFEVPVAYLLEEDAALEALVQDLRFQVSDRDPQLDELLRLASQLNAQGLSRLCGTAEDLSGNPRYRKA